METLPSRDATRLRFTADRLPVSKRPIVALDPRDGRPALGDTGSRTLLLELSENSTLRDAADLARRLNEHVEDVSTLEENAAGC